MTTIYIGGPAFFAGQRCTAARPQTSRSATINVPQLQRTVVGAGGFQLNCNARLADWNVELVPGHVEGGEHITCERCGAPYTAREAE